MGTRHLIAVMVDGAYKVAQYGQWDGYPSGQGVDALEALRSFDLARFKERVVATHFATEEEHAQLEAAGTKWLEIAPQLSRDLGAKILMFVYESTGSVMLRDSIDFAGDSLFCEYAYVVDLDKGTFEVFRGFQREPHTGERFSDAKTDNERRGGGDKYFPVRFVAEWPLTDLPTKEAFLSATEEKDEEDDEEEGEAQSA